MATSKLKDMLKILHYFMVDEGKTDDGEKIYVILDEETNDQFILTYDEVLQKYKEYVENKDRFS